MPHTLPIGRSNVYANGVFTEYLRKSISRYQEPTLSAPNSASLRETEYTSWNPYMIGDSRRGITYIMDSLRSSHWTERGRRTGNGARVFEMSKSTKGKTPRLTRIARTSIIVYEWICRRIYGFRLSFHVSSSSFGASAVDASFEGCLIPRTLVT